MKILLPILLLATAATAHADPVKIQVNGPDGKPLAGARVRVQESSGSWMDRKYEKPSDFVSDANGVVQWESKFSLTPDSNQNRMEYGTQALARVDAPGVAAVGGAILKAGENVITLVRATTLDGIIRDENQQPLAGARLKIVQLSWSAADSTAPDKAQRMTPQGDLALETLTDAQGKWHLENLPVGSTAYFEAEVPGFRKVKFSATVATVAPPIFMRRGATIKGRILRPDGTGAAGVQFFAGDAFNQPRTDTDGRFEVSGIEPGRVTLQILGGGEKLPFILPYKAVQGLIAGEVRDVGDWKADQGVRVRGRVVGGTNKPIAKAQVSVWGAGDGSGLADANGEFDFVAQKGAQMATVYATGYISKNLQNVTDAINGVVDLGEITLKSARKINGILKNQAGAPVPGIYLRATQKNNEIGGARSDANGEFTFDTLDVGTYTIQSYNGKIVAGGSFTVATDNAPLAVTIEGRAPATANRNVPMQVRVVDENGRGVAGAQVALRLQMSEGSYSNYDALSDSKGALPLNLRDTNGQLKVTEVFRPGYIVGASDLKLENGVWRGEIRLQARGQFLRGRVVDANAKPLAGVAVALDRGFDLPVVTDDKGEFALPDAPASGVQILASDGPRFASFAVEKAGQPIEIRLPDATPADKTALADVIAPRAWWESWDFLDNWDDFGAARMETLALQIRENANDSWAWNRFLETLARREPARFVARESELRAHNTLNNDEPFENTARLAHAVVGSAEQKAQVRDWLASEQKIKRETTAENVSALLMRAEIAARLGDEKQTQLWLDYAAQIGDYVPDRAGQAWDWGDQLARIAPDAALKFVENWSPAAQMQLLQSALNASAKRGEADGARADWEQIQKLAVAAETAPTDEKTRVEGFVVRPGDLLKQAAGGYAQFLSRTDPRAAFDLVKDASSDDFFRVQAMPVIGKNAAKLGQYDVARLALKASFESNMSNTNYGADAARTAATFDDKLAVELFARLYANSLPNADDDRSRSSLGDYAAARASKWPGETRILVENEWPTRLEDAAKPRDLENRDYDSEDQTTIDLVGTMALVAPKRAVEMAEQLPARKHLQGRAFAALLTKLLRKQP